MMSIVGISAVNAIHSVLHAIPQVSRIVRHALFTKACSFTYRLAPLRVLQRQLLLLPLQLGIVQRIA